jgi:hypothetical protein
VLRSQVFQSYSSPVTEESKSLVCCGVIHHHLLTVPSGTRPGVIVLNLHLWDVTQIHIVVVKDVLLLLRQWRGSDMVIRSIERHYMVIRSIERHYMVIRSIERHYMVIRSIERHYMVIRSIKRHSSSTSLDVKRQGH